MQDKHPYPHFTPGHRRCAGIRHRDGTRTGTGALRYQLESRYLDVLLRLRRARQRLDPQLYRVAAHAADPQLAIFGLRGLLLVPGPLVDEDQQLIVAAMDSPFTGVRSTVIQLGSNVPGIRKLWPRIVADPDAYSLTYLDVSSDPEPDPAVIGSYPGAHFSYFASTDTRPWFTTVDPPDKVIAFLTRNGGEALTGDELKAKIQAEARAAYMKAAMSGDANKAMESLQQMLVQTSVDWAQTLADVSDTGEIRYIKLAPDHMIAVFADNVLHATSIVSLNLPPMPDEPPMTG